MMTLDKNSVWFDEIHAVSTQEVGGKNKSLGEMIYHLSEKGIAVPFGFATTASAFWRFLEYNHLTQKIEDELLKVDPAQIKTVLACSQAIRHWILAAKFSPQFKEDISNHYKSLKEKYQPRTFAVAVRSSATSEDLASTSFAGQLESFLSVSGIKNVLTAIKEVYASLYHSRAIAYILDHHLSPEKIAVSVGIQAMIQSDRGSSGVMFTLDTESGFEEVVLINASYGLGEAIVQGAVTPDEFYVHKAMIQKNSPYPIIRKILGEKASKIILSRGKTVGMTTKVVSVGKGQQSQFSLSDADIIALAKYALIIEEHYGRHMDIEWGKDGNTGKLYILQARPETVKSLADPKTIVTYKLKEKSEILLTGLAIGQKICHGKVCLIKNANDIAMFKPGHILVTDITDPSWEPIMKSAAAIITNRGGRTCHAAIVAREIGIPAVVGCFKATNSLKEEEMITLDCSAGSQGVVYQGTLPFDVETIHIKDLPKCRVKINMNIGNPNIAFQSQFIPNEGIGLARLEFIIGSMIGIHPSLILAYPDVPTKYKRKIESICAGYADPKIFYIDKLAEGIGTIAASFWPKPTVVRLSDFKSNEYRELLGGKMVEPIEENPMLGWRGASRYLTPAFQECFKMECDALRKVRNQMGLTNVNIMIPFVRTVKECEQVVLLLKKQGLTSGDQGLKIIMMCEIPSNALNATDFLEHVDGYSIGSNDMTQLVLGMDRNSEFIGASFDEQNPAVKAIYRMAIDACKKAGKPVGICGQAPSDYLEFAEWLVQQGISSISLNPDSIMKTWLALGEKDN